MRPLNGSFFIYGKSVIQVSYSFYFLLFILTPKEAERRILCQQPHISWEG